MFFLRCVLKVGSDFAFLTVSLANEEVPLTMTFKAYETTDKIGLIGQPTASHNLITKQRDNQIKLRFLVEIQFRARIKD